MTEGKSSYARAGVDIDAGNRAVELMRAAVRTTYGPEVLSDVGQFGGLFSAGGFTGMREPVLVATTDGVGTKVILAAQAGRYGGIGRDIVNHCINDILVQGARPLFFLDYVASSRLDPEMVAAIVGGMAEACREAGCALLGGETAEMPGVYAKGHFDVVGTLVGLVDRPDILPRPGIEPGDVLIGLASSGPHTNGYSLLREIFSSYPLEHVFPELGCSLVDALLTPHRSYLHLLAPFLPILHPSTNSRHALDRTAVTGSAPGTKTGMTESDPLHAAQGTQHPSTSLRAGPLLKALAHITGGGLSDNLPRVLPPGLGCRVDRGSWPVPPLWGLVRSLGGISEAEMFRVFNMGIGMVLIAGSGNVDEVQRSIPEKCWIIGEVVEVENVRID